MYTTNLHWFPQPIDVARRVAEHPPCSDDLSQARARGLISSNFTRPSLVAPGSRRQLVQSFSSNCWVCTSPLRAPPRPFFNSSPTKPPLSLSARLAPFATLLQRQSNELHHVLSPLPSRLVRLPRYCSPLSKVDQRSSLTSRSRRRTTAGSLYPAYASYKAIKSNDLQKLEVWLMYWVVMGFVMCAESTVEWMFAW